MVGRSSEGERERPQTFAAAAVREGGRLCKFPESSAAENIGIFTRVPLMDCLSEERRGGGIENCEKGNETGCLLRDLASFYTNLMYIF